MTDDTPTTEQNEPKGEPPTSTSDFSERAREPSPSLVAEFLQFLREEKKWWLTPIVVALLLLTALAWFGGTSLAPFVYPGL